MENKTEKNPFLKTIKSDNYLVGIIIGILVPSISYIIFYLVYYYVIYPQGYFINKPELLRIIAIALNFIPMRYYFVNLRHDKTGQSILAVTLIMTFLHFYNRW